VSQESQQATIAPGALVLDADPERIERYRQVAAGGAPLANAAGLITGCHDLAALWQAAARGDQRLALIEASACGITPQAVVARRLRRLLPGVRVVLVHPHGLAPDAREFDAAISYPLDEARLRTLWLCLSDALRACDELLALRLDLRAAKRVGAIAHWRWNPATGEVRWCEGFRALLALPHAGAREDLVWDRVHSEDRARLRTLMTSAAQTSSETALHYRVVHPVLGVRRVRQESVSVPGDGGPWVASAVQEVTDREGVEDTIRKLAYFDPLTDLPNRSFLNECLRSVVVHARRHDRTAAILHVDLDSFKRINDTLGHSAGDRLLQEVAVRLQSCVRDSDCVAREHGGEVWPGQASLDAVTRFAADEFIVVLSEVAQRGDPERVAQRILRRLREPVNLDGREVTMGASIGIAVYPDDAEDEDALLRNSALAMHSAKRRGRNNHQRFSPTLVARGVDRLSMEAKLRQALDTGGLSLHYQPKVEAVSRRLSGAEALLRWEHPELGMVPPSDFIPIAEETGLILPLGEWVISEVCNQLAAWRDAGLATVPVSINVSAQQLHDQGLVRKIRAQLESADLLPSALEFEVTESILMDETGLGEERLRELRALGSLISMDDFGTGYSSLSYLKRLPIDVVKIDRSFVRDILGEEDDQAILRAIITMAHQLRLRIVAEGVESDAQMQLLTQMRCDLIQGYVVSRPVPGADFARRFLTSSQRLAS